MTDDFARAERAYARDERDRGAFLRAEAAYLEPPDEQPDEDDDYDEDAAREDAEEARREWNKENRGWN